MRWDLGDPAVREAVEQIILEYGLVEPPVDPFELAAAMGLRILPVSAHDPDLLAMLPPQYHEGFVKVNASYVPHPDGDVIYLREDLDQPARTGALFHELGHASIPWHREVQLMGYAAITPEVREIMEAQANAFAVLVRFLGERFDEEAKELVYGLGAAEYLARRYGVSYEMGFRRYVEAGPKGPILRVFDLKREWATLEARLRFAYFVKPLAGGRYWPFPERPKSVLPPDHPFSRVVNEHDCAGRAVRVEELIRGLNCLHEFLSSSRRLYVLTRVH